MAQLKPIRMRGMEAAGKEVRPRVEGHRAQAKISFNFHCEVHGAAGEIRQLSVPQSARAPRPSLCQKKWRRMRKNIKKQINKINR